jgi:SAM-dependent methyltransferase
VGAGGEGGGAPHWADAYYGELYLDSVADLLSPRLSALEAEAVAALLHLGAADVVLDLACGHGRHARLLAPRVRSLVGLDRSGAYLRRAAAEGGGARLVRGDVRALPFASGAFDAAWSWYSSLFMFDDGTNAACLAGAARVLRPGGRLLVHHANPLQLAREPRAEARRTLADGSLVEEVSEFDAARGVDRCARRLVRPGGAVLAGTAELRYFMPSEWGPLAARAGLRLVELTTTPDAGRAPRPAPGPDAPDLIAILEKPT